MTFLYSWWRVVMVAKTRYQRCLLPLLLTCGLTILLAGCGDTPSTPSLSLMYWPVAAMGNLDQAIKEYGSTHGHLAVVTQQAPFGAYNEKLLIEFAAQSAPDVFWLPSASTDTMFSSFASHDGLHDLTSLVQQARANGQLHLSAAALKPYTYEGHVMAVPQGGIVYAISNQSKHVSQAFALILQLVHGQVPQSSQ